MAENYNKQISNIYKTESSKVLAGLIRLLGNFDKAEEAMQEAFKVALEKWPVDGIPKNPYSWLISTGKFKAIDLIRRDQRGKELAEEKNISDQANISDSVFIEKSVIEDDQLRLIFYCCHPALPFDSRIALSLRDVCGMKTDEIARAYLTSPETIKKRISRAKKIFRDQQIPFEMPARHEMNERLSAVLHVIYLIFNEGYSASSGEHHIRQYLTDEAVFLSRKIVALNPTSEALGLLALLLLQEARRKSRVNENGDLVELENQDRSLWDKDLIREALQLIQQAVMTAKIGPYTIQAAIASVHASADFIENTRWDLIVDYYDMLLTIQPSPIVEFNRAIAVGMVKGPQEGLSKIDSLIQEKQLKDYHLLFAAKADFSMKLGLKNEAINAYQMAIDLARQEPEKRYLQNKLSEIEK